MQFGTMIVSIFIEMPDTPILILLIKLEPSCFEKAYCQLEILVESVPAVHFKLVNIITNCHF